MRSRVLYREQITLVMYAAKLRIQQRITLLIQKKQQQITLEKLRDCIRVFYQSIGSRVSVFSLYYSVLVLSYAAYSF
jgi:hypothetical protein